MASWEALNHILEVSGLDFQGIGNEFCEIFVCFWLTSYGAIYGISIFQCVFMDMGNMSHCMSPMSAEHASKLLSQRDLEGFSKKNPLATTIQI